MAGVSLVGYSGSLIKEAVKDAVNLVTARSSDTPLDPIDQVDVTKVLVGMTVNYVIRLVSFDTIVKQACSSFCLPKSCKAFTTLALLSFSMMSCSTATQFVVEEKIMTRWTVAPLVAVGFEGLFGALTILFLMPFMAQPSISSSSPFFDLSRGWYQMINTPSVLWSGIAIAFSISLFNYFGLSVTRHVSATARSLTDTSRTLSIWLISLALGWEQLLFPVSLLQVLGFSFLV